MPYIRPERAPTRRTDPMQRTRDYVDRRGGLRDDAAERQARRAEERAPRGRR